MTLGPRKWLLREIHVSICICLLYFFLFQRSIKWLRQQSSMRLLIPSWPLKNPDCDTLIALRVLRSWNKLVLTLHHPAPGLHVQLCRSDPLLLMTWESWSRYFGTLHWISSICVAVIKNGSIFTVEETQKLPLVFLLSFLPDQTKRRNLVISQIWCTLKMYVICTLNEE